MWQSKTLFNPYHFLLYLHTYNCFQYYLGILAILLISLAYLTFQLYRCQLSPMWLHQLHILCSQPSEGWQKQCVRKIGAGSVTVSCWNVYIIDPIINNNNNNINALRNVVLRALKKKNNNNNLVWWHCHRVALYKMWYQLKSACSVVSMLNQIDVFLSAVIITVSDIFQIFKLFLSFFIEVL